MRQRDQLHLTPVGEWRGSGRPAVDTPEGRARAEKNRELIREFARSRGLDEPQAASSDGVDPVDGLLKKRGKPVCFCEAKVREPPYTLEVVRRDQKHPDSYLITHKKLLALRDAAALYQVPGVLLVKFVCGARYYWWVWDAEGKARISWPICYTKTWETSAKERMVMRDNAYLPFASGREW